LSLRTILSAEEDVFSGRSAANKFYACMREAK